MFSVQGQPPIDPTKSPKIWKTWKHEHPEFQRDFDTKITYDDDKILYVGGNLANIQQRALNLVLVDPENQTFKVIPSTGDVESCCWGHMSACYSKDSKVVVFGGFDSSRNYFSAKVAVITLNDLDSENPSAHWLEITAPTPEKFGRSRSSVHIHNDKMYVFGGGNNFGPKLDIQCFDLTALTWSECDFQNLHLQTTYSEVGDRFVFHENKVYAIQDRPLRRIEIIKEFDLETMRYDHHFVHKSPTDHTQSFDPAPYLINGKIYFFEDCFSRREDGSSVRQLLALDLDSREWINTKTESFPERNIQGLILCCNNHLLFCPEIYPKLCIGEFWSLPLETVNKVQQTMKEFFFEAPYSDISFEVESETIPAHKWLLTQKSKFFANLFSSPASEEKAPKIAIDDLKAPTFRALLEYLYSDHVKIDDTIALELLQKANKYSIPDQLTTTCQKHFLASIELENYVAFGKLAESIGATSLRDAVVTFIAKNMKKIKARKDFNDLSDALFRDSVVKFIVK